MMDRSKEMALRGRFASLWTGLPDSLPVQEIQTGVALFLSAFVAGLLTGLPVDFAGSSPAEILALGRSLDSFLEIFAVNAGTATLIGIGVVTGGLLSVLVALPLGMFLGVQTGLILAGDTTVWEMIVVTGPHALLELVAFGLAVGASLLPLLEWVRQVTGEYAGPPCGFLRVIGRCAAQFAGLMVTAYVLLAIAAGIEVVNNAAAA